MPKNTSFLLKNRLALGAPRHPMPHAADPTLALSQVKFILP